MVTLKTESKSQTCLECYSHIIVAISIWWKWPFVYTSRLLNVTEQKYGIMYTYILVPDIITTPVCKTQKCITANEPMQNETREFRQWGNMVSFICIENKYFTR